MTSRCRACRPVIVFGRLPGVLKQRLLLGPVLIAALLGVFALDEWLAGAAVPGVLSGAMGGRERLPPGLALFVAALAILPVAAHELAKILRNNGVRATKRITTLAGAAGLVVSCTVPTGTGAVHAVALVSTAAMLVLMASLLYYSRRQVVEGVVAAAGGALLAFAYLGLMLGFILALRREHSAWVVLGLLLVTKACDIGAYFTGRAIGRHRLIPWLSPGKTWEGLIGGVAASAALGSGLAVLTEGGRGGVWLTWAEGAAIGACLGLVGQAGDLTASLLKRDAGLKDSSRALPGFGGVLDVIDSPLLAAPAAYWLLLVLGHRAP